METMETIKTIATGLTMMFRSIYCPETRVLIGKEINGPVVKRFQFSPSLEEIEKTTSTDTDVYKIYCPVLHHKAKGLAFVGSVGTVHALTSDNLSGVAKFYCAGAPKSFALAEDAQELFVLSEEETKDGDIHYLYKIELEKKEFKVVSSVCNSVADLPEQPDKILVAKGGKELRVFDLRTKAFGEPLYTTTGSIMRLKTDTQGRYAFIKIKSAITRINLETKESDTVLDVKKNLIYDYEVFHMPTQGVDVLVVSADRDEGLFLFNVETNERYLKKMFGGKEDIFAQAFIKSLNILAVGCISGVVRLIDMSDIEALNAEDSPAITTLDTFESGIRRLSVSDKDEFLAIGTSKGIVHLYEVKNIKKNFKYHRFQPHKD